MWAVPGKRGDVTTIRGGGRGVTSRTHPSDICDIQDEGGHGNKEESARGGEGQERARERDRETGTYTHRETERETREKEGLGTRKNGGWWLS